VKREASLVATLTVVISGCGIRDRTLPGQPAADSQVTRPDKVTAFALLYDANCAGCHGAQGRGGAALALADPLYLAIADDATIRRVISDGVPGTAMPAFAQSAGGMLTDQQIDAIVGGLRARWARPDALRGVEPPPHAANGDGDATRGASVYAVYCSSCHGANGRGSERASSIVDGSFLALVSNQYLRTTVIVGRPELGAPDWRGNLPGRPMSQKDVSDVVAWLAAQRPEVAGQPYPSVRAAMEGRQ
jgi:cytochrome c oxidase cbb3-type subunit III